MRRVIEHFKEQPWNGIYVILIIANIVDIILTLSER